MYFFLKHLPKKGKLISALSLLTLSSGTLAYEILPFKDKVSEDYKNFYKFNRFTRIASVGAVAGIAANTSIDREIYDWYQEDIRSERTDDISKIAKYAGEGKYLLPLSFIASQAINFDTDSKLGAWGNDVARAYTLGLPFVWSTQYLTGASRPIELDGSDWRPFEDNNGVSGHAFVGAIPFLAMARNTDNEYMRYFAYFASGLAAWSRVNDGAHYTSQSILGWYFAYEVMDAVQETNSSHSNRLSYSVYPIIGGDTVGLGVQFAW
ncbi:hypothetical protein CKO50_21840 [Pseudoalteromonas sp. HM-SA03]|uniref:phosphatase PAP2 family protein n=1 Tax=Pseudoalteromonas sp. HM-SA03 TaxID=2029678 RepID=UPI000BADDAF3|nr:phosphatase PAP2 family protein [Pseudoalteromonas sp. HM-SA03]PAX99271.1 hypothetical protein CKO50_21840 [Pseudoalteromonas sp. HM-SA03]